MKTAFYTVFLCTVLALNSYSENLTNAPGNLVVFFKKAISSPPDVEKYVVSQRNIERNSLSYYVGARAGSNYFLQIGYSSNALSLGQGQLITGRSGTNAYDVGQNAVSFGFGSNGLTGSVQALFTLTRQCLDMGLAEIRPESVMWNDDTFTATNNHGNSVHGKLITSNGVPARLEISNSTGAYKTVEYVYPDPPASFNGFPSKMLISGMSGEKLIPQVEVFFYSVQLSKVPLADDYFSALQFIGPNIVHTNIYQDDKLYVQNRRGQMVPAPDSVTRPREPVD
jgi:hypothetical protein